MPKSYPTRWTVLGQGEHSQKYKCKCECGTEREVWKIHVDYGRSRSCGCLAREAAGRRNTKHGLSHTAEYRIWSAMKQRCENPKDVFYYNYGGRGIKVCSRWSGPDGFENFYADMGPRTEARNTLDRINSAGDYTPENCRWASRVEQARNTRTVKPVTHNNETKTIGEWAEQYELPYNVLSTRLAAGWDFERAVTEPINSNILAITDAAEIIRRYKPGTKNSANALAVEFNVSPQTIVRLVKGQISRYRMALEALGLPTKSENV